MDYKQDVSIDGDALDREWLTLPHIYAEYSNMEASARAEVNRLSARKDKEYAATKRILAEVSLAVRENPAAFGLTKATETSIDQCAIVSQQYQSALEVYHTTSADLAEATYQLNMLEGVKWSLEMKKKALEGLTHLWGSNYAMHMGDNKVLREQAEKKTAAEVQTTLNDRMKERAKRLASE